MNREDLIKILEEMYRGTVPENDMIIWKDMLSIDSVNLFTLVSAIMAQNRHTICSSLHKTPDSDHLIVFN